MQLSVGLMEQGLLGKTRDAIYQVAASSNRAPRKEENAACEREGITVIPLPVETLGGWHKKAVDQFRKLARAQAMSSGKEEDDAIRNLFQR
jgi:hypothetical protein